jgi:hypothetical protein
MDKIARRLRYDILQLAAIKVAAEAKAEAKAKKPEAPKADVPDPYRGAEGDLTPQGKAVGNVWAANKGVDDSGLSNVMRGAISAAGGMPGRGVPDMQNIQFARMNADPNFRAVRSLPKDQAEAAFDSALGDDFPGYVTQKANNISNQIKQHVQQMNSPAAQAAQAQRFATNFLDN